MDAIPSRRTMSNHRAAPTFEVPNRFTGTVPRSCARSALEERRALRAPGRSRPRAAAGVDRRCPRWPSRAGSPRRASGLGSGRCRGVQEGVPGAPGPQQALVGQPPEEDLDRAHGPALGRFELLKHLARRAGTKIGHGSEDLPLGRCGLLRAVRHGYSPGRTAPSSRPPPRDYRCGRAVTDGNGESWKQASPSAVDGLAIAPTGRSVPLYLPHPRRREAPPGRSLIR